MSIFYTGTKDTVPPLNRRPMRQMGRMGQSDDKMGHEVPAVPSTMSQHKMLAGNRLGSTMTRMLKKKRRG